MKRRDAIVNLQKMNTIAYYISNITTTANDILFTCTVVGY